MDLTILLKAALNPSTRPTRQLLKEMKPQVFEQWIDYLLLSEIALAQVTANSRWHPNGFLKIIVAQGNNGERVRVHIWPSQRSTVKSEDVHDHYWSFSSVVLRGQLEIQYFGLVSEEGEPFEMRELPEFKRDPASWGPYRFKDRGLVHLTQISRHRLKKGNVYSMAPCEIHRVQKVGKGVAATLVLQGPPMKNQTNIFLPITSAVDKQAHSSQRASLTSELRTLLISLRS